MEKDNDVVLALMALGISKAKAEKMFADASIPEGTPVNEGLKLAMRTKKPGSLPTVNATPVVSATSSPKVTKIASAAALNAEIVRKFNEEETEKRVKAEEILTKAVNALAKTMKAQTDFLKRSPKLPSDERIARAVGNASPYKTIGERLIGAKGGFTARNIAGKIGLLKEGSGGFFDDILRRREEAQLAMKQQRAMEVDKDETGKAMSDKELKARILRSQKAASELSQARAEKDAYMKEGNFTKDQFEASDVGRDINRRIVVGVNQVEAYNPAVAAQAERAKEKPELDEVKSKRSKSKSTSTTIDAEKLDDQTKIMVDQTEVLKEIRDNTDVLNQGLNIAKPIVGDTDASTLEVDKSEAVKPSKSTAAEAERLEDQTTIMEEQTDLLKEIRDNTGDKINSKTQKAEAVKPESNKFLDGIGSGLKSLGAGLKGLGSGAGAGIKGFLKGIADGIASFGRNTVLKGAAAMTLLSGALFVMSKALIEFAEVKWPGIIIGLGALAALLGITKLLANSTMEMIKGAAAMVILGGAVWVIGKALQEFAELDWPTLGMAAAAIGGLALAAAAIGTFAPVIGLGAVVIAGLGVSLMAFGTGLNMVTEPLDLFASGMERLAALDVVNLAMLGGALSALSAGMVAFGSAQALSGLGNLVGNFLTVGKDNPVEQLIKIGQNGEGVQKAADGLDRVSQAMSQFSKVDKDSMRIVNDFPWDKATAFVAAGGSMQLAGAKVSHISEDIASAREDKPTNQGAATTIVSAPVTNNSTSIVRPTGSPRSGEPSSGMLLRRSHA